MRALYLSAIDLLPGLYRDADLLAVLARFETDAGRLAVHDMGNLRHVHRRFRPIETTLGVGLARLDVTNVHIDTRYDDLAVLRERLDDLTGASLVLTGQDDHLVTLLDLRSSHYSTSGARLITFM